MAGIMSRLGFGGQQQPPQQPPQQAPPAPLVSPQMPNTEDVAALPREDRRSAKKIAAYIWDQFEKGKQRRRLHAVQWMKVLSIMRGIHYFRITNGTWQPLARPRDARVIRAVYPIMEPYYRREHGRLSENDIGVSARPITGRGHEDYYHADRAEAVLNTWAEEISLPDVYDEHNQHLLFFGMDGLHRYVDEFEQQVKLRCLPGSELYPIPHDATTLAKADGLIHATVVSQSWLEMQDDIRARTLGPNVRRMAKEANNVSLGLSSTSDALGVNNLSGTNMKGSLVLSVWMKPNRTFPQGEFMFMVGDTLFSYWRQPDKSQIDPLPNGKIPIEIVYYGKKPTDFWGTGFLEGLVPMQLEANRQLSSIVRSALQNRHLTFYDPDAVDAKDIKNDEASMIPLTDGGTYAESRNLPAFVVGAPRINRDVDKMMGIVTQGAKQAANYESDIILGQQSGRTEGGPATNLLNANAQIPLQPVMKRQFEAFKRTFPEVLDLIGKVWPNDKRVRAAGGPLGAGREMILSREQIPNSTQVILTPTPLIPGGRTAMVQMLFELRSMPSPEGGFELDSAEFRKSLRIMNVNPPGIRIIDEADERISFRIAQLVNDGQTPAIEPAGGENNVISAQQQIENHRKAIDLLRKVILGPEFLRYGSQVQGALMQEIDFHIKRSTGATMHPDAFDDDVEARDAIQAERDLDFQEQALDTLTGQFAPGGTAVA